MPRLSQRSFKEGMDSARLMEDTQEVTKKACQTLKHESTTPGVFKSFRGIFYVLISSLLMSFNSCIIKFLREMTALEMAAFRAMTITILCLPFIIIKGNWKIETRHYKLIAVRSTFQIMNIYLRFQSLHLLPLGIAAVVQFTNIFFNAVLGRIVLQEKLTRAALLSICLNLIGLCLIVRLPLIIANRDSVNAETTGYLIGVGCAITSAFLGSINGVILRHNLKQIDTTTIVCYTSTVSFFICVFLSPVLGGIQLSYGCNWTSWLLLAFGLLSFIAQFFATKSTRIEALLTTTTLRMSSRLAFSFILQLLVFNDPVDWYNGFGSAVVFLGAIPVIFHKWLLHKSEGNPLKQKYEFWLE